MRSIITLLLITIASTARSQIIISEVMYNEPASRIRLEWIELFNPADTSIALTNYRLVIDRDTLSFPENSALPSRTFAVLARQLLSEQGSDSFEGHWGDSSGYWGDYYLENYLAFDLEFSLVNSSGRLLLQNLNGGINDSVVWHDAGSDGTSIERDELSALESNWHQSTSETGSTPGSLNSSVPISEDYEIHIQITPRLISRSSWENSFSISYSNPDRMALKIEAFDDTGRPVATLLDNNDLSAGDIIWQGHDKDGNDLDPGIYILIFSLDNNYRLTRTIPLVIAP